MNYDQNNYNMQGSNNIPNNQFVNVQNINEIVNSSNNEQVNMNESFNNGGNNNSKIKKLVVIIIVVVVLILFSILMFGKKSSLNTDKNDNGNGSSNNIDNNNNNNNNIDFVVDDSQSKFIMCTLVGNDKFNNEMFTYEIIKPNWNRYTFLNREFNTSIECGNKNVNLNNLSNGNYNYYDNINFDHTIYGSEFKKYFSFNIDYSLDNVSSEDTPTYKDRVINKAKSDNILLSVLEDKSGNPRIFGDKNGYWYAYKEEYDVDQNDNNIKLVRVKIYKLLDEFVNDESNNSFVYNELVTEMSIVTYNNEGYEMVKYILNDIKNWMNDKYKFDLSKLSIDMLSK